MDSNPYDDNSLNWTPYSGNRQGTTPARQRQTRPANTTRTASVKQARKPNMPKQQALALVDSLKKGIVVSSIISFGVFGWLSTGHTISTSTSQTVSSTTATPSTKSSSTTTPSTSPTATTAPNPTPTASSSSNSSSKQSSGYGFGSSNSTPTPVTSTHVS